MSAKNLRPYNQPENIKPNLLSLYIIRLLLKSCYRLECNNVVSIFEKPPCSFLNCLTVCVCVSMEEKV